MRLRVRLFGGLAERAGAASIEVELADDATVADLRRAVAAGHPRLADALAVSSVAVDLEVARDDRSVAGAAEVALLPPVAGGAGDTDPTPRPAQEPPRVVTGIQEPPFDLDAVVAEVASPDAGATAVFLGTVRDHAPDLDDVVALEYSVYPEMAQKVLEMIASEIIAHHRSIRGLALLHAVGELPVGAQTVLIVCTSPHREQAMDACRDALERVKSRLPVWKREVTADGSHRWVGLDGEEDPPPPPAGA